MSIHQYLRSRRPPADDDSRGVRPLSGESVTAAGPLRSGESPRARQTGVPGSIDTAWAVSCRLASPVYILIRTGSPALRHGTESVSEDSPTRPDRGPSHDARVGAARHTKHSTLTGDHSRTMFVVRRETGHQVARLLELRSDDRLADVALAGKSDVDRVADAEARVILDE
jgi:hypothetical protein